MSQLDRREFLELFTAEPGALRFAASALPLTSRRAWAQANGGYYHFPQGLASGDPQPDAVMLWTRVETTDPTTPEMRTWIDLYVQVAEDEAFEKLVVEQAVPRRPDRRPHGAPLHSRAETGHRLLLSLLCGRRPLALSGPHAHRTARERHP